MSEAPFRRGLPRLRKRGEIKGYQVLMNRRKLGYGVLVTIPFLLHVQIERFHVLG